MKRVVLITFMLLQLIILPQSLYPQELSLKIKSHYEYDSTYIRIANTTITKNPTLNLVFILPVEAVKMKYRFGNGLDECKELIESNSIADDVVFIQPDYIRVPWYGNNPIDTAKWQLEYTLELIKNIQSRYPNKSLKTYLLGFSKSGFGSMTILLKHPDLIDGVMIWDAPLATLWNEKWEMHHAFGTEEYFMMNYFLLRDNGDNFKSLRNKKIVIGGYDLFENHSIEFLQRLDDHGINYIHDNSLNYKHEWNKDWVFGLLSHIDALVNH